MQGGAEVLAPGAGGRGDRGDAQVTIKSGVDDDNIVVVMSQSSNFIKKTKIILYQGLQMLMVS